MNDQGMFSGSASFDVYNGAVLAGEENVVVVSTQVGVVVFIK